LLEKYPLALRTTVGVGPLGEIRIP
jgi:hypothetical protein